MKEYTYTFTEEEQDCIVAALLLMQADEDTTDEGIELCQQILRRM